MPKIKVKNIPTATYKRICDDEYFCEDCSLHCTVNSFTICIPNFNPDSEEIIELSEKEFPTNREWMESLSNFELAALMTSGYTVKDGKLKGLNATTNLMTDINEVTKWLSQPCTYLMEEE